MHFLKSKHSRRWLAVVVALLLASLVAVSYFTNGIVAVICDAQMDVAQKSEAVQAYFLGFGVLAPIAYLLFVIVEVVVAPLPGLALYLPGGVIFGGFVGGSLALVGNVLGSGIACWLTRNFKIRNEKMQSLLSKLEGPLDQYGIWIVFLIRVNPLTSSDLISYAAGLTKIPIWKVMLGTCLGMAPLCYAQAYLAAELIQHFPSLVYPMLGLCLLYVIAAIYLLQKQESVVTDNESN